MANLDNTDEKLTTQDDFSELFIKYVDAMVDFEHFSRETLVDVLCRLARSFRLTKVVTEFYRSSVDEKDGKGEILCDFNEGSADIVVLKKELISRTGAIVRAIAYSAKGTEHLSNKEEQQLDICLRSMMSYIGRNRMQTAIENLAFHDNNGYPNFAYFFCHLEKMNKTGGFNGFTAIMYNLKDFSVINRDLGFEEGNAVMKAHFDTLRDMIGNSGTVCRVGGDNFAAIFPNEMLEKILAFFEGTPIIYDRLTSSSAIVSAYAGVFIIPSDFKYERPGNIVEMILPTCQTAKISDGTDVVYASMQYIEDKENASKIRKHFEEALNNYEFHAYYQPKVNVETGRITGAEALCRWIRDGRIIPPMDFIPILERNTDIFRLDFYMLDLVCKNIRKWLDEGKNVVRISINFSRKHLTDPELLDKIVSIINRYDIPYEYIEIELTETTTEGDYLKLKKLVEGLTKIGIHTSIDDFGIGYSSINLIRELPWNVMKIDRSLLPISSTDQKDLSTVLYKHITAMASDMGIECLTEGIETAEQVQILRDNYCLYAQGYYYDKPLPLDEFEKRLEIGQYPIN
jgi:EAL domain-containing protein (putative c-di-GMP-specific phosphodiesterase class I)/GGDEF domain-containing protein